MNEFCRKAAQCDDDFDMVSVMKSGLQKYSAFNVYGFTQSALALEHFEIMVKNYDLLISDIRMPQMNGFEFIKKLEQSNQKLKSFL
jgi:CheY-like chemotaxis protein